MRVGCGVVAARYVLPHVAYGRSRLASRTETAAVAVSVVERIAVVPVVVIRPDGVRIPPARVVTPVPRRRVGVPVGSPEPVVDDRLVDIDGLDDIVRPVDILIADYLHGYFLRLVFLHIDGSHILIDVFGEDGLQDDKPFAAFAHFHYTDIVDLPVAVEVEVAECRVGVVEQLLKLLEVFRLCK